MTLAACDDDNGGGNLPDFSAADDLSMNGDMAGNPDMTMPAAGPTAQIVAADVVGHPWVAVMGTDMGIESQLSSLCAPNCPAEVHQMNVTISVPSAEGDSISDGTPLNGCTANRYDVTSNPMHLPPPDEPAGTIQVSGYDTTYTPPYDALTGTQGAYGSLNPNINCSFSSADGHFHCVFGTDPTKPIERYIFIEQTNASPVPNPSPSPFPPTTANADLWYGSPGATIKFATAGSGTTYTDSRMTTLAMGPTNPPAPHVVAINTVAGTHSLRDLEGLFGTGANEIDIDYSCDGTNTKGSGCGGANVGQITGLLIQTSVGRKWDSFTPGASNPKFGTIQCVDTDAGAGTHQFKLTTTLLQKMLGNGPNGSVRVVMVRLKANAATSGNHSFYETAGRGSFAFVNP